MKHFSSSVSIGRLKSFSNALILNKSPEYNPTQFSKGEEEETPSN